MLAFDRRQRGTFRKTFEQYVSTRVGAGRINMGRQMLFDYVVKLGPRNEGYPIREQQCGPAPGDEGHTHMCRYMSNADP